MLGNPPAHPVHDARRALPAVAGLVLSSLGRGADASASACFLAAAADGPDADAMVPVGSSTSEPNAPAGVTFPPMADAVAAPLCLLGCSGEHFVWQGWKGI